MPRPGSRLSIAACLTFAVLFAAFPEDNKATFTVSPPPVGYPDFKAGDATQQAGGGAVVIKTDTSGLSGWLIGVSGAWQYQYSPKDDLALGASAGATFMVGDQNSLMFASVPLGASVAAELATWRGSTLYALGYLGVTLGYTSLKVTVPQYLPYLDPVYDETTLGTMSGVLSAGGGGQVNIALGGFVLSPFALWTFSGGVYSTSQSSSMSFVYPTTSGDIPLSLNSVYGFDLLYKPMGWSLSSQLRMGDGYRMFSMALRWLLRGIKDRARG
ncbi:MAG TPA: hypothetical protein VLH39_04470 [Magnetospirillaceae bacterium]|nr:hypothetical protein [Magnetospirillaceae bacterium]